MKIKTLSLDTIKKLFAKNKQRSDIEYTRISRNVTLYVSTHGSDETGNGTKEKPFRTPNRALEELSDIVIDCTIKMEEGIYELNYDNGDYRNGDFPVHIHKTGQITLTTYSPEQVVTIRSIDGRDWQNGGGVITAEGQVFLRIGGKFVLRLNGVCKSKMGRQAGIQAKYGSQVGIYNNITVIGESDVLRFVLCANVGGEIIQREGTIYFSFSSDNNGPEGHRDTAFAFTDSGIIRVDNACIRTPEEGEIIYQPNFTYSNWASTGIIISCTNKISIEPIVSEFYSYQTTSMKVYPQNS